MVNCRCERMAVPTPLKNRLEELERLRNEMHEKRKKVAKRVCELYESEQKTDEVKKELHEMKNEYNKAKSEWMDLQEEIEKVRKVIFLECKKCERLRMEGGSEEWVGFICPTFFVNHLSCERVMFEREFERVDRIVRMIETEERLEVAMVLASMNA